MGFLEWVKKTAGSVIDPRRSERQAAWADQVGQAIRAQRSEFKFDEVAVSLAIPEREWADVGVRVYRRALEAVWRDFSLTAREKAALEDLRSKLRLTPSLAEEVFFEHTQSLFTEYFRNAMVSGAISDREIATLKHIAEELSADLGEVVRSLVASESKAFLRNLFFKAIGSHPLDEQSWVKLLAAVQRLGLTEGDLVSAVAAQRHDLIERSLAEAKTDARMSTEEAAYLQWLLRILRPEPAFRDYVQNEIRDLRALTEIAAGNLPSVKSNALLLKGAEIVHFEGPGAFIVTRMLKAGPRHDRHSGAVTITDSRVVVTSPSKSIEIALRRILSLKPTGSSVFIQTTGSSSGTLEFETPKFGVAILEAAAKRGNQTLQGRSIVGSDRHIPREVRQRIWTKYGGRCAECAAESYLEFDHVVPVAKGGSNSDQNVQLLCRACNLKKSDKI